MGLIVKNGYIRLSNLEQYYLVKESLTLLPLREAQLVILIKSCKKNPLKFGQNINCFNYYISRTHKEIRKSLSRAKPGAYSLIVNRVKERALNC